MLEFDFASSFKSMVDETSLWCFDRQCIGLSGIYNFTHGFVILENWNSCFVKGVLGNEELIRYNWHRVIHVIIYAMLHQSSMMWYKYNYSDNYHNLYFFFFFEEPQIFKYTWYIFLNLDILIKVHEFRLTIMKKYFV